MSEEINIQDLVNEISQPNVECIIDNEVPDDPEERHPHIICSLVNIVKQCIDKEMYSPYIHIKDAYGKLWFNDRLTIKESCLNRVTMRMNMDCDIHLVKNKDSLKVFYYATTSQRYFTKSDNFYLSHINFKNGILDRKAYEKATHAVMKIIRETEQISSDLVLEVRTIVHDYDPQLQHWSIVHFAMRTA